MFHQRRKPAAAQVGVDGFDRLAGLGIAGQRGDFKGGMVLQQPQQFRAGVTGSAEDDGVDGVDHACFVEASFLFVISAKAGMTSEIKNELAFRELETAAGFGAAVFFTLDNAAVAGQEAAFAQGRAIGCIILVEGAGDAVAHGAGLAGKPAAADSDE